LKSNKKQTKYMNTNRNILKKKRVMAAIAALALVNITQPVFSQETLLQKIALGSCIEQMRDVPIMNTVVAAKPDLFLMIGDVIYPDVNDEGTALIHPWPPENFVQRMETVYAQMAAKPEFQRLKKNVPIMAIWDDHDYGMNDGAADFIFKQVSQQLFLDFFEEPTDSQRRKTPGIYDAKIFGPEGKRVQVILLDTRYFRTSPLLDTRSAEEKKALNILGRYAPNSDPKATVLGDTQWRWLEQQLLKPADIRLLVSSYPLIAHELGKDAWGNFPLERQKLFKLIEKTKANGIILLSGDVHFSEISQTDEGPYPLVELTSSAMAARASKKANLKNSYRISQVYTKHNFGLVEIDWEATPAPTVFLKTVDLDGKTVFEQQINLKALQIRE
jgi:alkaline phosphatase D